jgi:hypothetical protein
MAELFTEVVRSATLWSMPLTAFSLDDLSSVLQIYRICNFSHILLHFTRYFLIRFNHQAIDCEASCKFLIKLSVATVAPERFLILGSFG